MKLQGIDLNLLVALDALLQESSVTRAAQRVGLSTPAMSHALGRLRQQLEDPVLVRAGRGMVLSTRGQQLRPQVRAMIEQLEQLMSPQGDLDLASLERGFRIHATDHILLVLGGALDRVIRQQAPGVTLHFMPNQPDDSQRLRDGDIDLAIGVYSQLSPEIRMQRLFQDRFVCVMRRDHPQAGETLTLERYVEMKHIQIAPRGRPGGLIDDLLSHKRLMRKVIRQVPYFWSGLWMTSQSDVLLTISERAAQMTAPLLDLAIHPCPLEVPPYTLTQIWHPRHDKDPAHRWLRQTLHQLSQEELDRLTS